MNVFRPFQVAWRRLDPRAIDALLVVALALPPAVLAIGGGRPLAVVAVLTSTLPIYFRRRRPLAAYLVQIGGLTVAARFNTPMAGSVTLVAAILLGAYSCGAYSAHRVWSFAAVAGPAGALALLMAIGPQPQPPWPLLILAPWMMGVSVRSQVALLRDRAVALEREQEAVAFAAATAERGRIARELHDVIAHSVSVMVVQAGAARRTIDRNPEQAAAAMAAVESSGREALSELRRMLGLMGDEHAEPLSPQPGLAALPSLAEKMSTAGIPVEVRTEGEPRALPAGLELAAYRIVQEALTNTLKHARGARTAVVVGYEADALLVEVVDSGGVGAIRVNGSGRGLLGMKERVAAYGGSLDAGERPSGGFAVRARLPLPAS